jgi:hypothetical protein
MLIAGGLRHRRYQQTSQAPVFLLEVPSTRTKSSRGYETLHPLGVPHMIACSSAASTIHHFKCLPWRRLHDGTNHSTATQCVASCTGQCTRTCIWVAVAAQTQNCRFVPTQVLLTHLIGAFKRHTSPRTTHHHDVNENTCNTCVTPSKRHCSVVTAERQTLTTSKRLYKRLVSMAPSPAATTATVPSPPPLLA